MAVDDLLERPEARQTLLAALPQQAYEVFVLPTPEAAPRLGTDGGAPAPVTLPVAEERQWTIAVLDEGAPEPGVGHFKYALALDRQPFKRWALARGVTEEQLTLPKLTRLMMRLQGEEYLPITVQPEGADEPFVATRLDFPAAERADVLRGLRAFAADDACAPRLAAVYAELAAELRALGPALGDGSAESVRSVLEAAERSSAQTP